MNQERHAFQDDVRSVRRGDAADDEIDLGALVRTIWRRKWVIALCALAGLALGINHARNGVMPLYEARATLALESFQEPLVDFQNISGGFFGDDASITTEIEIIRSRVMLGKLVDALDLTNHPEFNPALRPVEPPSQVSEVLGGLAMALRDFLRPATDESIAAPVSEPFEGDLREETVTALLGVIDISSIEW
ncbi:MAG: Wzz/FepE/Etk N-terminal domain-containing protein, partial [Paracoccaceae bacterium]|nr:Wzz/FepE/Etk N-terminal domain-containing protein [Paracoccaceae bacterium]